MNFADVALSVRGSRAVAVQRTSIRVPNQHEEAVISRVESGLVRGEMLLCKEERVARQRGLICRWRDAERVRSNCKIRTSSLQKLDTPLFSELTETIPTVCAEEAERQDFLQQAMPARAQS